jgi:hypothetical protein
MRSDPRLLNLLNSIEHTDPTLIKAICVHEAAHGIYMRKAGAIKLRFKSMEIFWDSDKDDFDIAAAAIAPDFDEQWEVTSDNIDAVARFHAAGGVATTTLTTEVNSMDRSDLEHFRLICSGLSNQSLDALEIWKRAQVWVLNDLRSPQIRSEIWGLEKEFEGWLLETRAV